jgi:hypothetical protein
MASREEHNFGLLASSVSRHLAETVFGSIFRAIVRVQKVSPPVIHMAEIAL